MLPKAAMLESGTCVEVQAIGLQTIVLKVSVAALHVAVALPL